MRSIAVMFAFTLLASPALAEEQRSWSFRVFLEEREIGTHHFTLRGTRQASELRSEASFDVRWLFINAYRYRHDAVEHWQGDCLRSLTAQTRTNGHYQSVNARANSDGLIVEHLNGRTEHKGCVMSFAYWKPQIVQARRLLNSQTGELVPVQVSAHGQESVSAQGRLLAAQRYRITGPEVQIDLWYVDEQWVALEALMQGKRLRYELL